MDNNNISGIKGRIMRAYGAIIDVIVVFLILVMLVTLGVAFIGVLVDLYQALKNLRHEVAIQTLVISILSVFVLIELFRSFTDYLEFHRIRLRVLTEVAIVFILRDIFIGLYSHSLEWQELLALGFLLAVLIAGRVVAVRFGPDKLSGDAKSP
ncbi:MAG: phosphate-starvation-inducible PsiE family protein [Betaproteobacteria bacterium]|nr:phosphate-starvation-inducible PsiE family protein [Betaproteobacteria bacterium]